MDANDLLEPISAFENIANLHKENTIKFFDELVKNSSINVEENLKTVKEYKLLLDKYQFENKENKKMVTLKGFVIFLIIVFFVVFLILLLFSFSKEDVDFIKLIVSALFLTLGITLILILNNKILKVIAKQKQKLKNLDNQLKKLKNLGYKQLNNLNNLYDWNMHTKIINKTVPLVKLDDNFNIERYQFMKDKFGLTDNNNIHSSTLFVQSGSILGNPFLIQENYIQDMKDVTYTGSIHISWYETRYINHKAERVRRSETLYASISRPAPYYYKDTWIIYGNEAAPNLSFSRFPSKANSMDEKDIEKYVKSFDKELDKMVEKDINDAPSKQFTRLANTKFEALFHALNRDNEVEFRLLFTPLAQRNLIDLKTTKKPFGDDFIFYKKKKLNFIKTNHSQGKDFSGNPYQFVNFSYEDARTKFIDYNVEYFKNLFFDLAPLMSIPLYQQTKTHEYIYEKEYESNVSSYEHEVLANSFDKKLFKPDGSINEIILKTAFTNKENECDNVKVVAHSFKKVSRVENVPVHGGDGRIHSVPVHYYEYIPIEKESYIVVKNNDVNLNQEKSSQTLNNNAKILERGLLAYFVK